MYVWTNSRNRSDRLCFGVSKPLHEKTPQVRALLTSLRHLSVQRTNCTVLNYQVHYTYNKLHGY